MKNSKWLFVLAMVCVAFPAAAAKVNVDSDHNVVDWAPEVEVAVTDRFALEFELPFEDGDLVAYKLAAQATFGTAFDDAYIHGKQVIVDKDPLLDTCPSRRNLTRRP